MIKLTKEQAEKANKAWLSEYGSPAAEWSAVANALVKMGVLVEPTPPAPGPTIEERVAALEAKANRPASEPFVPTDPKPTPSLIEACAEAACNALYGPLGWGSTNCRPTWRGVAVAAITRFLEEPPSHEEADRACDAYLLVNGQQSGVRVNLGRMDAALEASRRVLLERVKGGV